MQNLSFGIECSVQDLAMDQIYSLLSCTAIFEASHVEGSVQGVCCRQVNALTPCK